MIIACPPTNTATEKTDVIADAVVEKVKLAPLSVVTNAEMRPLVDVTAKSEEMAVVGPVAPLTLIVHEIEPGARTKEEHGPNEEAAVGTPTTM